MNDRTETDRLWQEVLAANARVEKAIAAREAMERLHAPIRAEIARQRAGLRRDFETAMTMACLSIFAGPVILVLAALFGK